MILVIWLSYTIKDLRKMHLDNNTQAFFELVRAGLFPVHGEGVMVNGSFFEGVDWGEVYRMAEEQSVIGLVAEGIDLFKFHVSGFKIPQEWALQFVGQTLQIEQRNRAMNEFVAKLINMLREQGVYALLVKGQGIAQCYERPLCRTAGDIDLLLSESNYEKAKDILLPLASRVETEYTHFKHQGMTIDGWEVELHGTMHSRLSKRVDKMIDEVQKDVFYYGKVRSIEFKDQRGRSVQVFAPAPDEDVIFVFTHILHHFFLEGVGLRQICDWCRLLWTYRNKLDHKLLESRLRKAGLMSEWKAFAAFAVKYLGMPVEVMPLFDVRGKREEGKPLSGLARPQQKRSTSVAQYGLTFGQPANSFATRGGERLGLRDGDGRGMIEDGRCMISAKYQKKADRICQDVLKVGNFGHNKMVQSSKGTKDQSYIKRKFVSSCTRLTDVLRHFTLFPQDSIRFFGGVLRSGLHAAMRGE